MAKRVARVVLDVILYTAFIFDFFVVSHGVGKMTEGGSFLQGIIETLENGRVILILFLISVFEAVFFTYITKGGKSTS